MFSAKRLQIAKQAVVLGQVHGSAAPLHLDAEPRLAEPEFAGASNDVHASVWPSRGLQDLVIRSAQDAGHEVLQAHAGKPLLEPCDDAILDLLIQIHFVVRVGWWHFGIGSRHQFVGLLQIGFHYRSNPLFRVLRLWLRDGAEGTKRVDQILIEAGSWDIRRLPCHGTGMRRGRALVGAVAVFSNHPTNRDHSCALAGQHHHVAYLNFIVEAPKLIGACLRQFRRPQRLPGLELRNALAEAEIHGGQATLDAHIFVLAVATSPYQPNRHFRLQIFAITAGQLYIDQPRFVQRNIGYAAFFALLRFAKRGLPVEYSVLLRSQTGSVDGASTGAFSHGA